MHDDETWQECRPRPRPHCVRWGPSFVPKGHTPQFSAHVCCGQTAGWIKMPLRTEVGLGPGVIVLDGDSGPPKRDSIPLRFSAHVLWPNGWMGQEANWYRGRPRPKPHCVRWRPSSPKGAQHPLLARACCGPTVAHLSHC